MMIDFSQTYLYKLHRLTTGLDTLFDQNLRQYSDIGLSQFTLLLSVAQHQPVSQRKIAEFLSLSPSAISRQVEIAAKKRWITVKDDPNDRRGKILQLTPLGESKIQHGIEILEAHVFQIFKDENVQTNLMGHIDILLGHLGDLRTNSSGSLDS